MNEDKDVQNRGIWRFSVIGSIIHEHLDENGNLTDGSDSFPVGTLVVLGGKGWDLSEEVIGLSRNGEYVLDYLPIQFIKQIRCKRVYNLGILLLIDHLEYYEGWPWWDQDSDSYRESKEFAKKLTDMKAEEEDSACSSPEDSETSLPILSETPCTTIRIVIRPNEKKPKAKSNTPSVKAKEGSELEENSDRLKKWFRLLKRLKSLWGLFETGN